MSVASGDRESRGVMTPVPEDEFEGALRRALQHAADCVQPRGDGLTRIFRRLAAPWPLRQASLLVTDCIDLSQLIAIWLRPVSARAKFVRAAAGGPLRQALQTHALAAPVRLHKAIAWVRPALAAAVTAVAVMTGTVALSQTVARIEPASISASAGTAATAGGHLRSLAGDRGWPGPAQPAPARQALVAGGGGAAHQHSCAAAACSSGPAGAPAAGTAGQPATPPSWSAAQAHRSRRSHHHSHHPQIHQPQHFVHQQHLDRPHSAHYQHLGHHHPDPDSAAGPGQ